MAQKPKFILTNDSITITIEGKPYVVREGSPQYVGLKQAIVEERWDDLPGYLTVGRSIESWAKGQFTFNGTAFLYKGEPIPNELNKRVIDLASDGASPTPLFKFWERLQRNPSFRSVAQLYTFLAHKNIPIGPDGCFYAYKRVNSDYTDCHTRTIDNSPGTKHEMPRNKISDDPNLDCHFGFHVGAYAYANTFNGGGGKVVICKVDPEHVVCVPYDASAQKMRVCKYEVYGNYGTELPSTVFEEETPASVPLVNEEETEEVENKPSDPEVKPRSLKKGWSKFHKKGLKELMEESIADLRQYATYGLDIVGSSKIPGGKPALVARILEVRDS
jgi:hypothetical protein